MAISSVGRKGRERPARHCSTLHSLHSPPCSTPCIDRFGTSLAFVRFAGTLISEPPARPPWMGFEMTVRPEMRAADLANSTRTPPARRAHVVAGSLIHISRLAGNRYFEHVGQARLLPRPEPPSHQLTRWLPRGNSGRDRGNSGGITTLTSPTADGEAHGLAASTRTRSASCWCW